jgi:hypothetical protein
MTIAVESESEVIIFDIFGHFTYIIIISLKDYYENGLNSNLG